ncbi:PQQ-binding-like beta-propeller repeat protein [Erythrobacter arachoides]|uniref:PQQ-binding-like beta-propeller repeat protein n=1 Tax=Aurantiacibacter arachoides TaxID=1850444 RepID=A0A844ZZR3_9SPHN|nr:PQQ-binding-like beta-propeller repeat protein [Aurantiacibacter arachoides]MXO93683.1 PQQ-binding-like beta-propeller repeat protein [Aurantiacibacter arachoides]
MRARRMGTMGLAMLLASCAAIPDTGAAPASSAAIPAQPDGDWQTLHRDLAATRYSPLDQVTRANVGQLQQAWSYSYRALNQAVPLVIDGIMYFPAANRIVALDAATGAEVWVHTQQFPAAENGPPGGFAGRGLGYWPGDGAHAPRLLVMAGTQLMAFDLATGTPVASFGDNGAVTVDPGYSGTPTITGNVAIVGAASLENPRGNPGNPRGYDVVTGAKLWEFDTTPDPGERFSETWGEGGSVNRGGTNMWGFAATVDAATGTAYLPIAGPAHNYYGGDRPGTNLFGNSVVAVDARTGAYRWHFQTVHHDIWDIDMSHAGPLIPVTAPDGTRQMAIANVGKSSNFFLLDATDGDPVLPVEERPFPAGDVPGEYYHPTQPIPVLTPPLSRVAMTEADIVTADDTTATHAAACRAMWDRAGGYINLGQYTPFMYRAPGAPVRSTIQLPGGIGGVNWGGPAADPTTGMVYVNALDTSLVGWVEQVEGDAPYSFDASDGGSMTAYDRASVNGKGPFFTFEAPLSGQYDANGRPVGTVLPCYKPPWARLTAVNANTGEIAWAVPLGMFDEDALPEDRRVLGNAGSAGPTVTAGGLVFVGATNDQRFRAFDSASGAQLWETQLRGNANANPFVYRGRDGREFVAINAGGAIVAFALPRQ